MQRKHILGLSYSDQQKFWSKIQILGEDDCWEWQDSLNKDGYGTFYPDGSKIGYLAHRISLYLKTGEQDIIARHTCDNRACCNPHHLLWGNHQDNVDDMISRNRAVYSKGSNHGRAKLKEGQVLKIREAHLHGVRASELAHKYKVKVFCIHKIISRERWRHI